MKHAIPSDWDGQTFCRFAICWPDSPLWRALLRGLVTEPARGYFWDEKTGWIKDVLADFRQTLDHNLELPEVFMACNDQNIAEALQAIATAVVQASINNSSSANASANACCEQTIINQGGGSVGVVTQPGTGQPIPIYGTQPPIVLPPGTIPDGYETQEEYDLDKCQMANLIIDDAIESVRRLGAITTFNTIALAGLIIASIVGAIIFPPAAIPIAVGALIAVSGVTGVLAGLLLGMQDRRQDLVCALYEGQTVDSIIGTVADIIDEIILLIPGAGPVAWALKTLALVLINSDTLNQLFTKQAHADYPDADCSNCNDCICVPVLMFKETTGGVQGSGDLTPNGQVRTLTATLNENGKYYIFIGPVDDENCCDYQVTVTGYAGGGVPRWHAGADCNSNQTANYQEPIVLDETRIGAYWQWGNIDQQTGFPFTLDVIIDCIHV